MSPPDDNVIISNADFTNFSNYNSSAPVGVLAGGYAEYSMALLQKLQVPARIVDGIHELSPALAAEMPVLVVPSNGFIAFEGLETFRRNLEGYVAAGGNVIVQAQGKDTYWAMLPGGIAAFGYSQDASCYRGGSVVNAYHEIISSENLLTSNVHMDGFFMTVPDDAVTVLARAKNGAAGLVVYPYGMGYVIAGHIYPDYAFYTGQYDPDELNYTRDMITWALRPSELPRFAPLAAATLTFNLGYPIDQGFDEAAFARVEVMDPSRTGVFYGETIGLADPGLPGLLPGESVPVNLSLPALPNKLGLWHVMAQLYTADGLTIGERFEELNGRFAVTVLPAEPKPYAPQITVSLAQEKDVMFWGERLRTFIHIENNRDTLVRLSLQRDILHHISRGMLGVYEIPAHGSIDLEDGITVLPEWNVTRYRYNLLYREGTYTTLGTWQDDWRSWGQTSVWGDVVKVQVGFAGVPSGFRLKDPITGQMVLTNASTAANSLSVRFQLVRGTVIYHDEIIPVTVAPESALELPFNLQLPAGAPAGSYTLKALLMVNGIQVGQSSVNVMVDNYRVSIAAVPPSPGMMAGVPYIFQFIIKNTSTVSIPAGFGAVTVYGMGEGPVAVPIPSLSPNQQQTVSFSATAPQLIYKFDLAQLTSYWETQTALLGIPKNSTHYSGEKLITYTADVTDSQATVWFFLRADIYAALIFPGDEVTDGHNDQIVKVNQKINCTSFIKATGDYLQNLNVSVSAGAPFNYSSSQFLSLGFGESVRLPRQFDTAPELSGQNGVLRLTVQPVGNADSLNPTRKIGVEWMKIAVALTGQKQVYAQGEAVDFTATVTADNFVGSVPIDYNLTTSDALTPRPFAASSAITATPGGSYPFPYHFVVSDDINPGLQILPVKASVKLQSGQSLSSAHFNFDVLPSDLVLSFAGGDYLPGDEVSLTLANQGGINTDALVEVSLQDSHGRTIIWDTPVEWWSINHGGAFDFVGLTIPENVADGNYVVRATTTDGRSYKTVSYAWDIYVHSGQPELSLWTGKDVYTPIEAITGDGLLAAFGSGLTGKLNLQVVQYTKPEPPPPTDSWPMFHNDLTNSLTSSLTMDAPNATDLRELWHTAMPEYGYFQEDQLGEPVVADLDADGKQEIIYLYAGYKWDSPPEAHLYIFNSDGTPSSLFSSHWYLDATYSTPAVGDVNGDGDLDIVIGIANEYSPGFRVIDVLHPENNYYYWDPSLGPVHSSPKLADLNGDGILEIILQGGGSWPGYVDALPSRGPVAFELGMDGIWRELWSQPAADPHLQDPLGRFNPNQGGISSAAIGDIDGDSEPEIVIGFNMFENGTYTEYGGVHAFEADGTFKWSTFPDLRLDPNPTDLDENSGVRGSPVIADLDNDLDNDGQVEIVYQKNQPSNCWSDNRGCSTAGLIVLHGSDGTKKWDSLDHGLYWDTHLQETAYPYMYANATPAVDDLDGDGFKEIAAVGWLYREGTSLVVFRADGTSYGYPTYDLWENGQMYYNDLDPSPVPVEIDGDGVKEIVYMFNGATSYPWQYTGLYYPLVIINPDEPTNRFTSLPLEGGGNPSVADLNRDGLAEIIVAAETCFYCDDQNGNPFPDQYSGITVLTGRTGTIPDLPEVDENGLVNNVLWSQTIDVDLSADDPPLGLGHNILPTALNPPGATGQFYWRGTVTNEFGQVLARDSYPFVISGASVELAIQTDGEIFPTASVINPEVSVTNLKGEVVAGLTVQTTVKLPGGDEVSLADIGPIDLDGNQTVSLPLGPINLDVQGEYSITCRALKGGFAVFQQTQKVQAIPDEAPSVLSALYAPQLVGDESFTSRLETISLNDSPADFDLLVSLYAIANDILIDDFEDDEYGGQPADWIISDSSMAGVADAYDLEGTQAAWMELGSPIPLTMSRYIDLSADPDLLLFQMSFWRSYPDQTSDDVFEVTITAGDGTVIHGCRVSGQDPNINGLQSVAARYCALDISSIAATNDFALIELRTTSSSEYVGYAQVDDFHLVKRGAQIQTLFSAPIALPGAEARWFSFNSAASGDVLIQASYSGDVSGLQAAIVRYGISASAQATLAEYYPAGVIELNGWIENTGKMPVDDSAVFTVTDFAGQPLLTETAPYSLYPGDILDAPLTVTLPPGQYHLTGATRGNVSSNDFTVVGAQGQITLTPDPVYQPGAVDILSSVKNIGLFSSSLPVTYAVYRQGSDIAMGTINASPQLEPGAETTIQTSFTLEAGNYRIEAHSAWPFSNVESQAEFQVLPVLGAAMVTQLHSAQAGFRVLDVDLSNQGQDEYIGHLEVDAGFWQEIRPINIPMAGSQESFLIDLGVATTGNHQVEIKLFDAAGQQVATASNDFTIVGPRISLLAVPEYAVFDIGEPASLTYVLENIGDQSGSANFSVEVLENLIPRTLNLGPDESIPLTASFLIPEDIDANTYSASYQLSGADSVAASGLSHFGIQGTKVKVTAAEDKKLYCIGDILHLDLNVENLGQSANLDLVAVVNFNGQVIEQPFVLPAGSIPLSFDFTVDSLDVPHVTYTIETTSGRALYINSMWVNEGCREVRLWTDKQVYLPGEEVTVSVVADTDGPTTVSSSTGFTSELSLVAGQEQQITFSLPTSMVSGTQILTYTWNNEEYEYPFDVDAFKAYFVSTQLDKNSYTAIDHIQSEVVVWVNRDFDGQLTGTVIDPSQGTSQIFTWQGHLTAGENFISVAGDFSTSYAGVHYLQFSLGLGELIVAKTRAAFDVGNFQLMSIVTDQDLYELGSGNIDVEVWLWGEAFDGNLTLEFNSGAIINQPIAFDGYTVVRASIPFDQSLIPGVYGLEGRLEQDGLESVGSGSIQIADTTAPEIMISGVDEGSYYHVDVSASIAVTDLDLEDSYALLNGVEYSSGTIIQAEDEYSLQAVGWDASGNYTQKSVSFIVDKTPPGIWLGISDRQYFNYPLSLPAWIDELHPDPAQDEVIVTRNGAPYYQSDLTSPIEIGQDGAYSIQISSTDLAGNSSTYSKNLILDLLPPVIAVTGVESGAFYNQPVTPAVSVDDPNLEAYEITLNGLPWAPMTLTEPGSYTLQVTATDLAGNQAQPVTVNFVIDLAAPVISVSGVDNGGLYSSSVTPLVMVDDPNLASYEVTLNGLPWVPMTISEFGTYQLVVTARDLAGNESAPVTVVFTIENGAPIISVTGVSNDGLYNHSVTPVVTVEDQNLASYEVTLNGLPWVPMELTEAGLYTLVVTAMDLAGNQAQPVTINFEIDLAAPVISVTGVEAGAYYNQQVTPIVAVDDPNLLSFDVTLNGQPFTSGMPISGSGSYLLSVTAVDRAGNTSNPTNLSFVLDQEAPIIAVSGVVSGSFYNQPVSPIVTVDDVNLESYEATLNGLPFIPGMTINAAGTYRLVVTAQDKAGNQAQPVTVDFEIDLSAPIISVTGVVADGLYNHSVWPSVTVEDTNLSSYEVTLNDLPWVPRELTEAGSYALEVTAIDRAGNQSAPVTIEFSIDLTSPLISVAGVAPGAYYNHPVTPSVTINDADHGTYEITLNGVPWVPIAITEPGAYTLVVTAQDLAGNQANPASISFTLDFATPVVNVTGVTMGGRYNVPITPIISVDDPNLESYDVTLNGLPWVPITLSQAGIYSLVVNARDKAGNEAAPTTVDFVIDVSAPVISISGVEQGGYYNHSVTPVVTVDDPYLASYEVTLNGLPWVPMALTEAGAYILVVTAEDQAGNHAQPLEVNFKIDLTSPVISVTGVEQGAYYNHSATPIIAVGDPNLAQYEVTLNGLPWVPMALVEAGSYSLTVTAEDLAGNEAPPVTLTFVIDLAAPVIHVAGVVSDAYYRQPVTPVIAVEDVNLDKYEATLNGLPWSPTTIQATGSYTLVVTAADKAGNQAQPVTVDFVIDLSSPVISVTGVVAGAFYNHAVTPVVAVDDANLATYEVNLNGLPWVPMTLTEPGTYNLVVTATDLAGNAAAPVSISFTLDFTAPTISVSGVTAGSFSNHSVTPIISVEDTNLATSSVTLNSIPWTPATITAAGSYSLVVTAKDKAGNEAAPVILSFVIDLTPPLISITGVEEGHCYDQTVHPWVEVSDAHLVQPVTMELNGVTFVNGSAVSADGEYILYVAAVDLAGNLAMDSAAFSEGNCGTPVCGDTITISGLLPISGGTVLNYGNRPVVITSTGEIRANSQGVTIVTNCDLTIAERGRITADSNPPGDISISARNIYVHGGSYDAVPFAIETFHNVQNTGGKVTLTADENLELWDQAIRTGGDVLTGGTVDLTAGGDVIIHGSDIAAIESAIYTRASEGTAQSFSGNVHITADGMALLEKQAIDTATNGGRGGEVIVNAAGDIVVVGTDIAARRATIYTKGISRADVDGGPVSLTSLTGGVSMSEQAIDTSSRDRAGSVSIIAPGLISLFTTKPTYQGIYAWAPKEGAGGGDVYIESLVDEISFSGPSCVDNSMGHLSTNQIEIIAYSNLFLDCDLISQGGANQGPGGRINLISETGGVTVGASTLLDVHSLLTGKNGGDINIEAYEGIDFSGVCDANALSTAWHGGNISFNSLTGGVTLQSTARITATGKTDPYDGTIDLNVCTFATISPLTFLDPTASVEQGVCQP